MDRLKEIYDFDKLPDQEKTSCLRAVNRLIELKDEHMAIVNKHQEIADRYAEEIPAVIERYGVPKKDDTLQDN